MTPLVYLCARLYITYLVLHKITSPSPPTPVTVSFDPTTYTVTEGEDVVANLRLIRHGVLTETVVTVTITAGTARGMQLDLSSTLLSTITTLNDSTL